MSLLTKVLVPVTLASGLVMSGVIWSGTQDVNATKDVIDEFVLNIDNLINEKKTLQIELDRLQSEKSALDVLYDELFGTNEGNENEIITLNQQISDLNTKIDLLEGQIAQKNTEITDLEQQVADLQVTIGEKDDYISHLEDDLTEANNEVKALREYAEQQLAESEIKIENATTEKTVEE
ncbi:hypothetical protein [Oceanobacillus halophilus]|uniref:Uncharacterized protein n=1 Tax=Oceanobacillus halophilus TaxID=930130 RepID=A0A494ZTK5_9BACI|nr:hypothetical protein [Oceanobacillus halophilus]RKQ29271.1 hypothetical protein D8M06_17995 [Oceanobacillus halophilus]